MKDSRFLEEGFLKALKVLAPGTVFREGLDNILSAKTGGLIVVSDCPEVMELVEGGFNINVDLTPANLYELAKMDGAIIISPDGKKILKANTQLVPDHNIPSVETGIRHRTAERVARQTGELIIAISQRRNIISLYKGAIKYVLQDMGVILNKANQAIQTLEKYKAVLDKALMHLCALEFENLVTIYDVVKVVQRTEMVLRISREIEKYISELGKEGRLVSMQLEELIANTEDEGLLVIQDYCLSLEEKSPENIMETIAGWSSEDLLDFSLISRALGYTGGIGVLDYIVYPRGYRILNKVPRLPWPVIDNLVKSFGNLSKILNASIDELDEVEGIGEVRARSIKEGLKRYRDQIFFDRYI